MNFGGIGVGYSLATGVATTKKQKHSTLWFKRTGPLLINSQRNSKYTKVIYPPSMEDLGHQQKHKENNWGPNCKLGKKTTGRWILQIFPGRTWRKGDAVHFASYGTCVVTVQLVFQCQ
jgi:hypothetical protein